MVSLIRHELREESFFSFPLYKNMGRGGGNKVPFPRADLSIGSAQCTPSRWSSLQCTPSAFSPPPILCSYFFPIFLPPNQSLPPPTTATFPLLSSPLPRPLLYATFSSSPVWSTKPRRSEWSRASGPHSLACLPALMY